YKTGRLSFDTEVNQTIYAYGTVTGDLYAFTGTDRGSVDPKNYLTNGLVAGSGAGGPKAVAVGIYFLTLTENTTTATLGNDKLSSSEMSVVFVSDPVFPSDMGSLTSK
ncbi:unnamed protein product, partial [Closterium sp. NIES-64]